jgi:hypothetical protein
MSRNYAQFATSIWHLGDDFGDLTMPAQWAYFMLTTQPDISAAGVLSLNVRRWSKRTKDCTRETVIAALQELQAAGKVFYDYDTEELLIRTFVKWDGGYGNQKRRPVIERAAFDLQSPRLRGILADELRKLDNEAMALLADRLCPPYGIAHPVGHPAGLPSNGSTTDRDADHTDESESDKPALSQVDSLSDGVSDRASLFDGVVVTQEGVGSTSTHNPQPQPSAAPVSGGKRGQRSRGTRLPDDWRPSEDLLKWAAGKGFTFNVEVEDEKFVNHWRAKPGKDGTKLDWPATWRNWMINASQMGPRLPINHSRPGVVDSNAPKAIPSDQRCPKHPNYRAGRCGPCRSEQRGAADRTGRPTT